MATIGSLVIDLAAETTSFRRDLGRARRDLNRFGQQTGRQLGALNSGFVALGRSAKAFVGVFAAAAGLRSFDQMLESVDQLGDTAEKLGLTAEELQRLRFAAEQTGVATNTLDMAIQRFTRRVGEAAQGGGELADTLTQYGIDVTDAAGRTRDTRDVLADLADTIQGADSDAERLRIGFKAFDSEGAALVNTLRRGSEGLQELTDRASVLSEELVSRAGQINDQWSELVDTIGVGLRSAILGTVIAAEDLVTAFMPGVFRIATTAEAARDQLAGLREEAARLRTSIGDISGEDIEIFPGLAFTLRALQDELGVVEEKSFQVAERLRELSEAGGDGGGGAADTTAADKIASVTQALQFQVEQLDRTNEVQQVYNELRRAGVARDSDAGRQIRSLVEDIQAGERAQREATEAADEAAEAQRELAREVEQSAQETQREFDGIQRSSERTFGGMGRDILAGENALDSLSNAAKRTVDIIISEFLRLAVIRPIVGGIFGALGFGGVATSGAAPGLESGVITAQHGAEFTAPPGGGTDGQHALLGLSQGEKVTVETPAQQRAGGAAGITFNQTFNIQGEQLGNFAVMQRMMAEVEQRTVAAVQQLMNDGGPMAVASGRRR